MMMKCIVYGLMFLTLVRSIFADEIMIEEEAAPAEISVIAIGPAFLREYEKAPSPNAIPVMKEIPPNAVPPSKLYHRVNENDQWADLNVGFNSQISFSEIPSNKSIGLYVKKDAETSFVRVPQLASETRTIVLLSPTGSGETLWLPRPRLFTLNIGKPTHSEAQLILVNLSKQSVGFDLQDEKILHLPSSKSSKVDLSQREEGSRLTLSIRAPHDRKLAAKETIIVRNAVVLIYAFYDIEAKSGRSIGVFRAIY